MCPNRGSFVLTRISLASMRLGCFERALVSMFRILPLVWPSELSTRRCEILIGVPQGEYAVLGPMYWQRTVTDIEKKPAEGVRRPVMSESTLSQVVSFSASSLSLRFKMAQAEHGMTWMMILCGSHDIDVNRIEKCGEETW